MLSKLIKHEWKNVSKMMILINSFTVIMTLIGCISAYSPLWQSNVDHIFILGFSALMLYYITIIAVSFSSMIYLAVRFYKNLYTDEGYLMHTLPVTPRQLILSKGFVATCWTLITSVLIMLSIFCLGAAFALNLAADDLQLRSIMEIFPYIVELFEELFAMKLVFIVLWGIVYLILGSMSGIATIYGAIALGQLFNKHKVLGAFLSYIGIYILIQTVTSFAMAPFMTRMILAESSGETMSLSGFLNPTLLVTLIMTVIIGIVLYVLTEYIMTKKLNLD